MAYRGLKSKSMRTTIRKQGIVPFLLVCFIETTGQELRTFNQNPVTSNHARITKPGMDFQITPQYAINMKGNTVDSLFFRGNGSGVKMNAGYSFGNFGIGLSSGFLSSQTDKTKINEFFSRGGIPLDQLTINTGNQQNMYALIGPYAEFGKKIKAVIHTQGGLFVNNSGYINIQRKGATSSVYRNEPSSKSIFPGFSAGVNLNYAVSDQVSIGFSTDYLNTKSEVVNYDIRRGAAIEGLKLSKNVSNVLAGISIRYSIKSPRDAASGQSTGKRQHKPLAARESSSGMSTGKTYQPGKPVYGNITVQESCGPVTIKTTDPDGTTEERTFACPEDAANYSSRLSTNVTTGKQTQGATFGEKVNAGLHQAGSVLSQGASLKNNGIIHRDLAARNIISGKLTWGPAGATMGIVTNNTVRGGSLTMNSQNSSTRQTSQNSFGTMVRLSAREAGSGMATGKRSREAGSGLATGRRQYEPVFMEGQDGVCNPCLVTAKMSVAQSSPLYKDKGLSGANPLYEGNKRTAVGAEEDCNGVAGADIYLIDAGSGAVAAKTKTERCGDFFFANVPEGDYVVKVSGSFIGKKGYDIYLKSKTDLQGGVTMADDWTAQLLINTTSDDDEMQQKAGISTSRSNLRSKSLTIIDADLDGDGEFESLRATGTFTDGSTRDITNDVSAKRVNKIDAFTIKQSAMRMNNNATSNTLHLAEIRVASGDADSDGKAEATVNTSRSNIKHQKITAVFSDGSAFDITNAVAINTSHSNIRQYSIVVADLDGDGAADAIVNTSRSNIKNQRTAGGDANGDVMNTAVKITKSRSNIQNNRMISDEEEGNEIWSPRSNIDTYSIAVGDLDGDGRAERAKITKSRSNIQNNRMISDEEESNEIWSPRSNIKILRVATGDVDGDGKAESIVGGLVPGGAVISAAMRPGEPIPGIDVKMGKNPGGSSMQSNSSNGNGEFEFMNLEAGDYTLTIEQRIFIEDETFVAAGGYSTRAQDHNSSRSNKTSGIISDDPDNGEDGFKKSNTVPVKWTVPETLKAAINTSHSNIKNMLAALDETEQLLNGDNMNAKATVNTTRSNIKNQRTVLIGMEQTLEAMETMDRATAMTAVKEKMAAVNRQFMSLQELLTAAGSLYTSVSNVLKTKHDTVKNSISNIR